MLRYTHQDGRSRIKQVTFLRGTRPRKDGYCQPHEFQMETFYDHPDCPLAVHHWMATLARYVRDGVVELLTSGHTCAHTLKRLMDDRVLPPLPIFLVGDMGKIATRMDQAAVVYPWIRYRSDQTEPPHTCTERRAMATFLYLNKWLM